MFPYSKGKTSYQFKFKFLVWTTIGVTKLCLDLGSRPSWHKNFLNNIFLNSIKLSNKKF